MLCPRAVRPPVRPLELSLVVVLVVAGALLRWQHLGTPSLWWDEVVQIRTADRESAAAVWTATREGTSQGAGNAGAMPLDYLLLHAWTRLASAPSPSGLERHYRLPAFCSSVLALPLVWGLGRAVGGPVAGVTALTLLATSLPHVLYAAEVRPYALYVLAAIVQLAAFVALAGAPERIGRWVAFAAASLAFAGSALYAVFPIALELAVLGAVALVAWRRGERRAPLGAVVAVGITLAVLVAWWLDPSRLGFVYPRAPRAFAGPATTIWDTLGFFAGGASALRWVFLAGLLATPTLFWRTDRRVRALAAVLLAAPAAIPAIALVAQWKSYYYHPRHAMFLLPMVHLCTALVVGRLVAHTRYRGAMMVGVVLLVLAATAPTLAVYRRDPIPFFRSTKTLRDFRGLATLIAQRVTTLAPDTSYLLVLERRQAGHLANPTLAFYLTALGIRDRVVLRGIGHPARTLERFPAACRGACRGPVGPPFAQTLELGDPFDLAPPVRTFMDLPMMPWVGGRLGGAGVVTWGPHLPAATPPELRRTTFDGLVLFEPRDG